jgi:hypothetical protein
MHAITEGSWMHFANAVRSDFDGDVVDNVRLEPLPDDLEMWVGVAAAPIPKVYAALDDPKRFRVYAHEVLADMGRYRPTGKYFGECHRVYPPR